MDKDDRQGIKRLYTGANLGILLLLALAISLLFLWSYRQAAAEHANELHQEILRSKHEFIQDAVNRTIQDIEQERVLCANKQNGSCAEDAIKERLRERIRALRLRDNGYIWINAVLNYEGGDNYAYRFVHPNLPETEGMMLSTSIQDINGNFPYLTELEGVKKNGELFFDYWFEKMDSDVIEHKLTFAKLYEPYDWIVATGVYLDDVDELVQSGMVRWRKKVSSDVLNALVLTSIALFLTWLLSMAVGKRVDSMYAFFLNEVTLREEALRRHKEILEEQVRERTASLQASEEKLKESEERLRLTLEAAQIGIFDWDTVHNNWFASPEFYTMLGYPPKNGIGDQKEWLERAHPDDRTDVNKKIQAVLQGRFNDYQYEARLRHADGTYRWQYARGFGIKRDQEGRITRILGIQMDITERKQAEEELKAHRDRLEELVRERTSELIVAKDAAEEARRLAEAANQAKSIFLANMSHELRTPLNAILGYADILKRRAGYTDSLTDGLDIIRHSGEHLLTLINDVLDLAKIEAGRLEFNPVPFHLSTFLREIIDIIRGWAEAKDLSLTYEALSSLPATVLADEKRLRQVLLNLLGNAVKFTDQGYVTLRVTAKDEIRRPALSGVEGMKDENLPSPLYPSPSILLTFEVEDTGPGIAADQLERIFQPFEQVSEADRQAEGAGLGLTISQQIMQLMGSRLQVKSEPGHGSTFWFDVALPVIETIEQEQPAVVRDIVGYEGVRRRVLVADDKAYNRLLLVDMLEPLGFEVQTAEDGQQAVAAAQAWRPDVILMDLVMSVKTGLEAVQELRQHPAFEGVFIIAVSASVLEVDREKSRVAGCDAFLPKPIRMDNLLELLGTRLKLTWVYAEPEELAAGAAPLLPPPPETLVALYELARIGEILEIQEQALRLEEMDAAYIPFARKLQELAQGFEIAQIVTFVEQFLEEKQDEHG